jgi:hypothetical protein
MSPSFPSSSISQDVREKSPVQGVPQVDNGSREPYANFVNDVPPSGWTSSRLASCLSTFAMCPPCSSYESQPSRDSSPVNLCYESHTNNSSQPFNPCQQVHHMRTLSLSANQ